MLMCTCVRNIKLVNCVCMCYIRQGPSICLFHHRTLDICGGKGEDRPLPFLCVVAELIRKCLMAFS